MSEFLQAVLSEIFLAGTKSKEDGRGISVKALEELLSQGLIQGGLEKAQVNVELVQTIVLGEIRRKRLKDSELDGVLKLGRLSLTLLKGRDARKGKAYEADFKVAEALLAEARGKNYEADLLLMDLGLGMNEGVQILKAYFALNRGFGLSAFYMLDELSSFGKQGEGMLLRLKAVRFSGDRGMIEQALLNLPSDITESSAHKFEVLWLNFLISGDVTKFKELIFSGQMPQYSSQLFSLLFLIFAHSETAALISRLPATKTLRSWLSYDLSKDEALALEGFKILRTINQNQADLSESRRQVMSALALATELSFELRLIFLLAMARWAARHKQSNIYDVVLAGYTRESLRSSNGKSTDLFGMLKHEASMQSIKIGA